MDRPSRASGVEAMTLTELLVAMGILMLLCVACFQIIAHVNALISRNREVAGIHQEGDFAFALLGEHLSRATLSTRTQFVTDKARIIGDAAPGEIGANSSLMFVSGPATKLGLGGDAVKTHGLFFQALLGEDNALEPTTALANAMNEIGYFIQVNDGKAPEFLANRPLRPRLMQFRRWPQDALVYKTLQDAAKDPYEWFQDAIRGNVGIEPVANNILALVIVPKQREIIAPPDAETAQTLLSPCDDYLFDTRERALFPDALEVILVVAGEASLARYESANPGTDFDFGQFTAFDDIRKMQDDLDELLRKLDENRIIYRVFSSTFDMRGAGWQN